MTRMMLAFTLALLFTGTLVLGLHRAQAQPLFPPLLHSPRGLPADTTVTCRPMGFMTILVLSVLLVLLVAGVQPAAQMPRIGLLSGSSPTYERLRREEAFRQGLLARGYIEGQNIHIEYRYAEGQFDRLPALALDLVDRKVDLLVASGTEAVAAAQQATQEIPIVMTHVGDPVARGFVESLARPARNITGLSNVSDQLAGKHLELLIEVVPQLSRVAVLWNPPQPAHEPQLRVLEGLASARGIALDRVPVHRPDELEGAFTAVLSGKAEALIVLGSALHYRHLRRIAEFALTHRVPAITWERTFADSGLLMTYGPDELEIFRRAAYYVDRLLKDTKPADFPVEQPTAFELIINLRTAHAFDLSIPPSLLLLAKEVIR